MAKVIPVPYVFKLRKHPDMPENSAVGSSWSLNDLLYVKSQYNVSEPSYPHRERLVIIPSFRSGPKELWHLANATMGNTGVSLTPVHKVHQQLLTSFLGSYYKKKQAELLFTYSSLVEWIRTDALNILEQCFHIELASIHDPKAYKFPPLVTGPPPVAAVVPPPAPIPNPILAASRAAGVTANTPLTRMHDELVNPFADRPVMRV